MEIRDPRWYSTRSQPSDVVTVARPPTARHDGCARVYRGSQLVCGHVKLTLRVDPRLGLTARERRCLTVRFLERLEPGLRMELAALVARRGAVARRAAERMRAVEIEITEAGRARQRIIASVQPPQWRHGDLHEIEFGLRELGP